MKKEKEMKGVLVTIEERQKAKEAEKARKILIQENKKILVAAIRKLAKNMDAFSKAVMALSNRDFQLLLEGIDERVQSV